MRLDERLNEKYRREVKRVDAAWPRARNSVLDPQRDRLSVVYEVFTAVYRGDGRGKRRVNLLFCHGSGMNRAIWEYHADKLASAHANWVVNKVVLVDQANHGDSWVANQGKLGMEFDWFDGARDIVRVAEEEFTADYHDVNVIVGHSMGGFQALAAIAHSPTMFQFGIVIEPVIIKSEAQLAPDAHYTIFPARFYTALKRKMLDTFANELEYNTFITKGSLYTDVHPDIRERMRQFEKLENPDGTISTKMKMVHNVMCYATKNFSGRRMVALMKFVPCPVVMLVGGDSRWTPPINNETVLNGVPNCSKIVIPKGGHMVNLEMPNIVISHITSKITEFIENEETTTNPQHLTHPATQTERALFLNHNFKDLTQAIDAGRQAKL
ncbi:hypothetical protein RNJ44_02168 [Nakaseomyces bracarensis]|uniref:AB hydrolase-1 domain-containing protein n=1 Tax=Nakaseomyces bracarensis TaxID=273131 RepID=A0ABR4NMP4_9SACH